MHTGPVFVITIIVVVLTLLLVWLTGLETHHTLFLNSLLSLLILSIAFFLFIVIGLFRGVKMKDTVGKLTDRIKFRRLTDLSDLTASGEGADGCFGGVGELVGGIIAAVIFVFLLWFFANILWMVILLIMAMFYWVFFRALRLVFAHSARCKGDLILSMGYGLLYTFLYNFWIFGIILAAHYLIH